MPPACVHSQRHANDTRQRPHCGDRLQNTPAIRRSPDRHPIVAGACGRTPSPSPDPMPYPSYTAPRPARSADPPAGGERVRTRCACPD